MLPLLTEEFILLLLLTALLKYSFQSEALCVEQVRYFDLIRWGIAKTDHQWI